MWYKKHHHLQVEELKFVHDLSGKTLYVEWVERLNKTSQEGLSKTEKGYHRRCLLMKVADVQLNL